MKITSSDALLLVDIQNDFLEEGSLAVPNANAILLVVNQYIALFTQKQLSVIATRDWHPANHCSFQAQGGPWPVHCVADTPGAALSSTLNLPDSLTVVSKAVTEEDDTYSNFEGTDLQKILREKKIERLFVCGLATDYCVLHTVKDGLKNGFAVVVLQDGIKAVNVQKGDGDKALAEMVKHGARVMNYEDVSQ